MPHIPVGTTSYSLIERVALRDEQAWNRLAELYVPLVMKWSQNAGLDEAEAADISQEVFQVVAARIGDFFVPQGELRKRGQFRAWLRQITRNKLGDLIRRKKRQETATGGSGSHWSRIPDPDSTSDDEDSVEDHAELFATCLRLIKTDFNTSTWQAFFRVTVEEQPITVVAENLGLTVKAVRQAKYRVLKRLREEFRDLLD